MTRSDGHFLCSQRRWLSIAGIALLVACQSNDSSGLGVRAVQFKDVVVPTGFRLRDGANESYSREEANWRMAHFVYTGQTTIEDAVSYVRQRMPQHSWSIVGDETADSGVRLRFERGIYKADYQFSRSEGATVMVVDYATDYNRR